MQWLSKLVPRLKLAASSTATDSIEAVIIHTNDVHGRILEEKGVIGDAKAAVSVK